MKKVSVFRRVLSAVLSVCMVLSLLVGAVPVQHVHAASMALMVTLSDSFGDGWSGAQITMTGHTGVITLEPTNWTISSGKKAEYGVWIEDEGYYIFSWTPGAYDKECSFVFTLDGVEIYRCDDASALEEGVFFVICNHESEDGSATCTKCGQTCGEDFEHTLSDGMCSFCGAVCGIDFTHDLDGRLCQTCGAVMPALDLVLLDSYGDEWGNSRIYVYRGETRLGIYEHEDGAQTVFKIPYDPMQQYTFVLSTNNNDYEAGMRVLYQGTELYSLEKFPSYAYEETIYTTCAHSFSEGSCVCSVCGLDIHHVLRGSTCSVCGEELTLYTVNIADSFGGSVSANVEKTASGMEVELTNTPAAGYLLDRYTVTDADGESVTVVSGCFAMPEGGATVSASFVKDTGDFVISGDDGWLLVDGVLTISEAGSYRVSMASGVTKSDHSIVVDAENVTLTLSNVNLKPPAKTVDSEKELVPGTPALTLNADTKLVPDGSVILEGGNAHYIFGTDNFYSEGGPAILGNAELSGSGTLTLHGGYEYGSVDPKQAVKGTLTAVEGMYLVITAGDDASSAVSVGTYGEHIYAKISLCAHESYTDGYCNACGTVAAAKVVSGDEITYHVSITEAMTAAKEKPGADVHALADSVEDFTIPNGVFFYGAEFTFSGNVTNDGSYIWSGTFNGTVTSTGMISGGTFNGVVNNEGVLLGGTFNGAVNNKGALLGGTFNGAVTNNGSIDNGASDDYVITLGENFTLVNNNTIDCESHFYENGICRLCGTVCTHEGSTHTAVTDKGDGTHGFTCTVCGDAAEAHSFDGNGTCVCGVNLFTVSDSTLTIDGTLGSKTAATEEDITVLVNKIKECVDGGITTITVTGEEPAVIEVYGLIMPAVSEAIYRLRDDESYYGKIDLILQDVTQIVDQEFNGAHALNCITLPEVTTVGDGAFYGCLYLKTITFGSVVTSINQKDTAVFHMVGEYVDGCDLVLNCGQMKAENYTYRPDLENNVWFRSSSGDTTWKSITLTHSYGDWVSNGDGTHTRTCANDSTHTENGDCSGGEATCTAPAVCENCGASYGALTDHSLANGTCTECGEVGYIYDAAAVTYTVYTAEGLFAVAELVNDGAYSANITLAADIVLNENLADKVTVAEDGTFSADDSVRKWTPIGGAGVAQYKGTFDGGNHTITGLYSVLTGSGYSSLIGFLAEGATVKNVKIHDFRLYGRSGGTVVGFNRGKVSGCSISGSGIFGCVVDILTNAGGIVAFNNGTVENCSSSANLYLKGTGNFGGIVGTANSGSSVTGCYRSGTLEAECVDDLNVGGIVGNASGDITDCHNSGSLKAKHAVSESNVNVYVGGIAGESSGNITCCSNSGSVETVKVFDAVSSEVNAGGIAGILYNGTVFGCYNSGSLSGEGTSLSVGGIAGECSGGAASNCYNNGSIDSGTYSGGITAAASGTFADCYYLDTCVKSGSTVQSSANGITEKTSDQFASGEVAYLLNGDQSTITFKQTLLTDAYPSFTGGTVYQVENCKGEPAYSNTNENIGHNFENSACTACGITCDHSGSTHTAVTDNGDGTHSFTCTVCGAAVTGEHTGGTATCTTPAVCKACGVSYGKVDTNNHDSSVEYENGFCENGCYEPAALVTNENYESFNLKADYVGYYAISNAGQLFWFAQQVNEVGNKEIKGVLTADIDLENRPWTPIGNDDSYYNGSFDGSGKTIKGLNIHDEAANYVGLFGVVYQNGHVKAVTLTESSVTGADYVGGIAGWNRGTVTGCVNNAVVSGSGTSIGGIVGENGGTVELCGNTNTVTSSSGCGGIAGRNSGTIRNCHNTGEVRGTGTTGNAGGITYLNMGTVEYSWSTGKVTGGSNGEEGGIVGRNTDAVRYCCATQKAIDTSQYGSTTNNVGTYTADRFASGEVAYMLGDAWGQTIGTDPYPVLGGAQVYHGYTSCGDTAAIYTNDKTVSPEKPAHTGEADYTPTGDGKQHIARWSCCGTEVTEAHTGGTATCQTQAVCQHCGESYGELDPNNHEYETNNGICCGTYQNAELNESGYYEIDNAGKLFWFAQQVNGGGYGLNAKLVNNITLNENLLNDSYGLNSGDFRTWTPMGDFFHGYSGIFDGQGYVISGLYIPSTNTIQGMFSVVTGTVKNVILADTYVQGAGQDGGLVGYLRGGTVSNCGFDGVVKSVASGGSAGSYTAGVVAYTYGGTIENCFATGKFNSEGDHANPVFAYADTNGGAPTLTNNYYLENCSTDSTGTVNAVHCNDGVYATTEAQIASVTEEQILSGEVAYLLGSAWGQTIGTDSYPVLGGAKVYEIKVCEKTAYSNTEGDVPHNYVNGFCTAIPGEIHYQPAPDSDSDGFFEIGNAGQMFWFANHINTVDRTASAVLTADIDLEGRPWTPIGSTGESSNNFRGTFDGQNHTIRGLYVEGGRAGLGFFGEVRTGTVKNFTIYGEVVANTEVNYVGGVFGSICGLNSSDHGLERNGAVIQNITSYVNLTAKVHGIGMIGGFVGYANHQSLIENCAWYGTFDAGIYRVDTGAGGFIGKIQENTSEVTIRNCGAYGTIKTNYAKNSYNNTPTIYMGGFLSFSNTNAKTTLENCLFAGKFERGANLTDQAFLGAFGTLRSVNAIKNCYYLGDDGLEAVHSDSNLKPGSDNVKITGVTGEQLLSGEIAYKLGSAWGQTIGTDDYPILGGRKVYYGYADCKATEKTYANSPLAETELVHSFNANGFCSVCDEYEPASDAEGDGYYDIDNAGKLYWFAQQVRDGNTTINGILTDNIVVNENVLKADGTLNGDGSNFRVWIPTSSYTGTFDGNGKKVSGLYHNNSETDNVGLFGSVGVGGTVRNVGIIDSYLHGDSSVGGVAGANRGTVTDCYNSGAVSGRTYVGGVVGSNNSGTIANCGNTGSVSGTGQFIGGVSGCNSNGTIESCYNTGAVSSSSAHVGGVTGSADGTITDCYNTGAVSGSARVGGIAGKNDGTVKNCYNTGTVSGSSEVYGVIGFSTTSTEENCYYLDTAASGGINGKDTVGAAEPKTAAQFASGEVAYLLNGDQSTIVFKQTIGTDAAPGFTGETVYAITNCVGTGTGAYSNTKTQLPHDYSNNNGFCTVCDAYEPAELVGRYYQITNAGQLYWFAVQVNSGKTNINGELKANIVVNEDVHAEMIRINPDPSRFRLWTPIGTEDNGYIGDFCGYEHTVSGLYFNDSTAYFVGLFGFVRSGTVNHVGVIDSYFSGSVAVGGVVGCNFGTVEYAYNTGTVKGYTHVGGVVGDNYSTVKYAYNTGTVKGDASVGGVVGSNQSTVKYAYNTGSVSGETDVGGVAGVNYGISATATNCYFDSTVYTGNAIGTDSGTATDVEGKTGEQFASGEVAYLLGYPFGQTIGTHFSPVLYMGDEVYYGYTSCGDVRMVYTNDSKASTEKPEHTGEATYTVNSDGTHSASYSCCGTTVTEDHTYENGKCPCGAYDLWVAGEQITDSHLTVSGTTGTATYDPTTDTLTLNDFDNGEKWCSFTNDGFFFSNAAVYTISDLNVVLEGENRLHADGGNYNAAIQSDETVTIDGDGTLLSGPLYSAKGTIINGGTLDILGVDIAFDGPSTTINGGSVNVSVNQSVTFDTLTVNGGRVVLESSDRGVGRYGTILIGEGMAVYDANGVLIEDPDFKTLQYALIRVPCDHTQATASYTWTEDPITLKVTVSCPACGETFTGSTEDIDVTISDDGFTTTYTATVTLDGQKYTNSKKVTNQVTSVDIAWGSMEFTYTEDETGEGAWGNPGGANRIAVTNTGNTAVTVTAAYTQAEGYEEIEGKFFASEDSTHTETAAAGETAEFYLYLEGEPNKALKNTTVGTVTISIQ